MTTRKFRILIISFISIAVASCAIAPARSPNVVPAGYLYTGDYINIRVPNADGWHLVNSSPAGMEFAHHGISFNDSFAAQVLIFSLDHTSSDEEFMALIKKGFEADSASARYASVKSKFEIYRQRSYPCISVESTVDDTQAHTSPKTIERLSLQIHSLYCRHPIRTDTGFAIVYSYRGNDIYQNLKAEAVAFFDGVQVPSQ